MVERAHEPRSARRGCVYRNALCARAVSPPGRLPAMARTGDRIAPMGRLRGLTVCVVTALTALVVVVTTGNADVPTLTKADAARAVKREARADYKFASGQPTVHCNRLTRTLFNCRFCGLTQTDVFQGRVDGHSGKARVRRYQYGIDVLITAYHAGGGSYSACQ